MRRRIAALAVIAALLSVGFAAPASAAAAAPAAAKVHWHTVSFVLGLPPGAKRDASTVTDARTAIANVDAYYRSVSKGSIRFRAGKVLSWTKVSSRCSLTGVSAIAKKRHLRLGKRSHVAVYEPVECGFAGLADLGGRRVILASQATSVAFAHELGHNLGLGHSNSSGCTVAFVGKACKQAKDERRMASYGDNSDLMGGGDLRQANRFTPVTINGTLGPWHLLALRLLPHRQIRTINPAKLHRARIITLSTRESRSGVQAVSLPWSGRRLLVSYLQPTADAANGRLLVQSAGSRSTSLLLPVSGRGDLSGPLVGSTYRVGTKVVMEVLSTSGNGSALRFRRVTAATPTSVKASPGIRSATVTWKAKSVAGLSGYEVRLIAPAHKQADAPQVVSVPVAPDQRSVVVPGLESGTVWRAQVIPQVSGFSAPAGVSGAVRPKPDPASLPTFPVVDVQASGVHVQWLQPVNPASVIDMLVVTARVDRSGGWSSQSMGNGGDTGGDLQVPFHGPGVLTVTAVASYGNGETYTVVLRHNVRVH